MLPYLEPCLDPNRKHQVAAAVHASSFQIDLVDEEVEELRLRSLVQPTQVEIDLVQAGAALQLIFDSSQVDQVLQEEEALRLYEVPVVVVAAVVEMTY